MLLTKEPVTTPRPPHVWMGQFQPPSSMKTFAFIYFKLPWSPGESFTCMVLVGWAIRADVRTNGLRKVDYKTVSRLMTHVENVCLRQQMATLTQWTQTEDSVTQGKHTSDGLALRFQSWGSLFTLNTLKDLLTLSRLSNLNFKTHLLSWNHYPRYMLDSLCSSMILGISAKGQSTSFTSQVKRSEDAASWWLNRGVYFLCMHPYQSW